MTDPTVPLLDGLAADYWDAFLRADPQFATALGERRFDGRLPDVTPEGQRAMRVEFAALLARLDALPAASGEGAGPAVDEEAVTRSALRVAIEDQLTAIDTGLIAWNVDTLDGIPVHILNTGDYQPAGTPAERAALLERWRGIGPYVDAHAANLRRSLAGGLVACVAPVERVIDVLAGLLTTPDASWPLMTPVETAFASGAKADPDRDRFAAQVESAIREVVRPAFARLHDTLATEIRPAARPEDRPGLCHVPGGDAAYRGLVRLHTSLDASPEELHRTGLAEIERIDAETEELAGRVLGRGRRAEAVAALRSDPALHFDTRDAVAAKAVQALARATEAIPDWFGRLPQAPCEVVRMGAHEEEHSTVAFYRQPALDGSRPGQYYINTAHPETRPRYEAEALAYHESIPGHHLQLALAQERTDLPAFRRNLGPTAFIEGWALYIERLADEMGLYTGDVDRIGVLSFDAWRASRLVVDTGMHAMGWTRRQAIAFMLEHTVLAPNNIGNEVDRYIVLPGQALAYKAGQLELLRLRAEAHDRLGTAFDIRAFHDTVLAGGALALPTLRGIVEAWVTRTAAAS